MLYGACRAQAAARGSDAGAGAGSAGGASAGGGGGSAVPVPDVLLARLAVLPCGRLAAMGVPLAFFDPPRLLCRRVRERISTAFMASAACLRSASLSAKKKHRERAERALIG